MFLNEVPLWIFLLPYKQNENPQSQEFLRGKMTLNGTKCALAAGSAPSPSEESVSLKRLAHSHSKIAWAVLFFNFFRAERNRTMGPKRLPSSLPQFWKSSSVKKTTIKTWGWKIEMLNAFQSKLWCGWSWSSNQRMFHNYGLFDEQVAGCQLSVSSNVALELCITCPPVRLQLHTTNSCFNNHFKKSWNIRISNHFTSYFQWKKQNIWHIGFCSIPILTQKKRRKKRRSQDPPHPAGACPKAAQCVAPWQWRMPGGSGLKCLKFKMS